MAQAKKTGTEERRAARRAQVAQEREVRQEAREAERAEARTRRVLAFRSRGVSVLLDFGDVTVVDFDPADSAPLRDIEARVAIQQILRLKAEKNPPN